MDRRDFIKSVAASSAILHARSARGAESAFARSSLGAVPASDASVDGYTKLAIFARGAETWTVYEDLSTRDGVITFVSSAGTRKEIP